MAEWNLMCGKCGSEDIVVQGKRCVCSKCGFRFAVIPAPLTRDTEADYLETLAVYRELAQTEPREYLPFMLGFLPEYRDYLRAAGRLGEAERTCREELAALRRLGQYDSWFLERIYADALNGLGLVLSDAGRFQEAEDTFREALSIYERIYAEDPRCFLSYSAEFHRNLGNLYLKAGRTQDAKDALAMAESLQVIVDDPCSFDY